MFSDYHNNEKQSYKRSHLSHHSTSSTTSSFSFSSSFSEKGTELHPPPPYSYIFYNSIDDKPLPPLPTTPPNSNPMSLSFSNPTISQSRETKVRFLEEKPLPALPPSEIEERSLRRIGSANREYAWWTKRWSMSDEEYERIAREKERPRSSSRGKFIEDL